MKHSNAIAHLRRLCCSGLNMEIVIEEFLRAVPTLIASNNNTFTGTDDQLYPKYHIASFDIADMRETIPNIVASFHTSARQRRAIDWFKNHIAITDARVLEPTFYQSDLYNLVYKTFDMHHVLWMPVAQSGKPIGMLSLYRPKTQKPFGNREQEQLGRLVQYVAHALSAKADEDNACGDSGRTGMMILNARGQIISQSREAERLMGMARYPRLVIETRSEDRLLAKLAQLCSQLNAVYRGEQAPPPNHCHTNAYGRFLFRAYRLQEHGDYQQNLTGLTIEHKVPVALMVLRAMQALSLSPMQQEVAQCVAQGMPFETIGRRLHIKPTTVKDHVGKIYTKLNICQREELLPKLLAIAS